MKIYIAADHAGFYLKKQLLQYLDIKGYEVEDMGAFEMDEDDDYPDIVYTCAQKVAKNPESTGIIVGGSGQGEAIVANKVKGIRAAIYNGGDPAKIGRLAKADNNANILAIGARFVDPDNAKKAITAWLEANFSEERHKRRVAKISEIEKET